MGIKNTYKTIAQPNFASFDFYDLFTGTGFKTFYGADVITGAGTQNFVLSPQVIYADTGISQGNDLDFDLSFEVPIILEGDCMFNIWVVNSAPVSAAVQVDFKHVDALGTETQIGTQVSKTLTVNDTTDLLSGKYVIPLTRFKAGEKLRINLTKAASFFWLFDPKNRNTLGEVTADKYINSQFTIILPLRL